MASIDKRGDRWRVRWRNPDGQQREKTFDLERDAVAWRVQVEGGLLAGTYIDPRRSRLTLEEWVGTWAESIEDLRRTSRARLLATVHNQVLPRFGHYPLSGLSNAEIRGWAAQLRKQGLSGSTRRKAIMALRRILAAAAADRRIGFNPADEVPLPAEESGEQRFLTPAQVLALAGAIHPRFSAMVLVAAYGGLRFGECAALRRSRVDLRTGTVQVAETLTDVDNRIEFGPPKTRNARRTVPLPRRVARALGDHIDAYCAPEPGALVFTGTRGNPLRRDSFRRAHWLKAVRRARLAPWTDKDGEVHVPHGWERPLTFHELRHTFVSLWISLDLNPKEVSQRAGHSSVAFTLDRYGHLYEQVDDDLADRLDAMLGEMWAADGADTPHQHQP